MTQTIPVVEFELKAAKALSACEVAAWQRLLADTAGFTYPSLNPLNVIALAAVLGEVHVAVARINHAPVGFFPFTLDGSGKALPAAQWFMSFQGLVTSPGLKIDPRLLLQAIGARRIVFDRFLALSTCGFETYQLRRARSPIVDLRNGYDGYRAGLEERGSRLFKRATRKWRRAEHQCGALTLADETDCPGSFDWLVNLRQQRNREILAFDFLSLPWTRAYMQETLRLRDAAFRGRLFVLRFGGRPAAALFALQSGRTLECAITAFDPALARLSPGLLLFHALIRDADRLGFEVIHLTRGTEPFKERFENAAVIVSDLEIGRSRASRFVARQWLAGQEVVRASPLGQPARRILRRVRLIRGRFGAS